MEIVVVRKAKTNHLTCKTLFSVRTYTLAHRIIPIRYDSFSFVDDQFKAFVLHFVSGWFLEFKSKELQSIFHEYSAELHHFTQ